MNHRGLTGIALPQLEHLLRLVQGGELTAPLTSTALHARGLGSCWDAVAWLGAFPHETVEAVLQAVVAERAGRRATSIELVWTGPEAKVSAARDTAVVVRDLFNKAERSALVAGFSFSGGGEILKPLHAAMRDRGVDARIVLHIEDRPGWTADEAARHGIETFLSENWPFGPPFPGLYYDPRTVAPGSSINLHAKCVVVDRRFVLTGSANFTHNGHARNIEVGVLVDDFDLAVDLERQWQGLIDGGMLAKLIV